MLSLILYKNREEIFSQYKDLFGLEQLTVVSPHPRAADEVRAYLQSREIYHLNVITIAFFLRSELRLLDLEENLKSKSHWLLELSERWFQLRGVGDEREANIFLETYELLTELRSYSLDFELIGDILEEYLEEVHWGIKTLWQEIQQNQFLDEQKATVQISHYYDGKTFQSNIDERSIKRTYIFWGMDFFSGIQIDMLKSMGELHDIYILFPEAVFHTAENIDWIRWINVQEVVKQINEEIEQKVLPIINYPRGKRTKAFRDLILEVDVHEVFLGSSEHNIKNLLAIPIQTMDFSFSSDLFEVKNRYIFNKSKKFLNQRWSELNEFRSFLEIEQEQAVDSQDFRLLRVVLLWKKAVKNSKYITEFHLRIIFYSVALDLPRLNSIPLERKENFLPKISLKDFDLLPKSLNSKKKMLFLSHAFSMPSLSDRLPPEVMFKLANIGPVKNKKFQMLLFQSVFLELLENNQIIVCAEDGVIEENPYWKQFFSIFKFEKTFLSPNEKKLNIKKDFLYHTALLKKEINLSRISASKIQTYIDCPKKYLHDYQCSLKNYVDIPNLVSVQERGQILHQSIGYYFSFDKSMIWNEENFLKRMKDYLILWINEKNKKIFLTEEFEIYFELEEKASKAIKFILFLKNYDDSLTLEFEKKIKRGKSHQTSLEGILDLLVSSDKHGQAVLDFKRSGFSIPSKKEMDEFSSIQILFYLQLLDREDVWFYGYLNLDVLEESLIFSSDQAFIDEVYKKFSLKINFPAHPKNENREQFNTYILNLSKNIEEEVFPIRPRKKEICLYCSYQSICPKGESLS